MDGNAGNVRYEKERVGGMDPTTKVGRGMCSSFGCEEPWVIALHVTRWWGLCAEHGDRYAVTRGTERGANMP